MFAFRAFLCQFADGIWGLTTLLVHGVETARNLGSNGASRCQDGFQSSFGFWINHPTDGKLPLFYHHNWFNRFNQGSKTGKHGRLELRHGNRRWDGNFCFGLPVTGALTLLLRLRQNTKWGQQAQGRDRFVDFFMRFLGLSVWWVWCLKHLVSGSDFVTSNWWRYKKTWMAMSHDQNISAQKICRWCLRRASEGCDRWPASRVAVQRCSRRPSHSARPHEGELRRAPGVSEHFWDQLGVCYQIVGFPPSGNCLESKGSKNQKTKASVLQRAAGHSRIFPSYLETLDTLTS